MGNSDAAAKSLLTFSFFRSLLYFKGILKLLEFFFILSTATFHSALDPLYFPHCQAATEVIFQSAPVMLEVLLGFLDF